MVCCYQFYGLRDDRSDVWLFSYTLQFHLRWPMLLLHCLDDGA